MSGSAGLSSAVALGWGGSLAGARRTADWRMALTAMPPPPLIVCHVPDVVPPSSSVTVALPCPKPYKVSAVITQAKALSTGFESMRAADRGGFQAPSPCPWWVRERRLSASCRAPARLLPALPGPGPSVGRAPGMRARRPSVGEWTRGLPFAQAGAG